jgi:hypothetical protein
MPHDSDELVTIVRTHDLMQADLIRAQLASEGIEVFIPGEYFTGMRHIWARRSQIKVQVLLSQAPAAVAILGKFQERADAGEFDLSDEEDENGSEYEQDMPDNEEYEDEPVPQSLRRRSEMRLYSLLILGPLGLWLIHTIWGVFKDLLVH